MIGLWVSPDDLENSTSDLAPAAARAASRILYALTGRIYKGEQESQELYLPPARSLDPSVSESLVRYGIGTGLCRVEPFTLSTGERRIPLRNRPVRSVTSVHVPSTNALVPAELYRVTDSTYLVTSGSVPSQAGLKVTYVHGNSIPEDGAAAARALADELVMLFSNSTECRLKNVTSLSRQGVNIEFEDAKTILTDGRVGIPEVDLFVASVNPTRAKLRSRVLSADSFTAR